MQNLNIIDVVETAQMFIARFAAPLGLIGGLAASSYRAECQVQSSTTPVKSSPQVYDVCVVGGGIVGLATAREILTRYPQFRVAIVEKESEVAHHQTGSRFCFRNLME
jgi:NADPH-dependent 2,4-dienoyl-CoA reductase/sulfur reductase-like enzyme